ncbi:MAG: NnrS family protein, partial [Pseudorhodobacter sp.]
MSCASDIEAGRDLPQTTLGVLGDEGFRLFFPLSAVYAAVFPLIWVLALGFDLPLARTVPSSLWHAHEMLIGAFGAALIGFLTTAAPEWTDTKPLRGRLLWLFAGLWGIGRFVGALGWDAMSALGALADLAWMAALLAYLLHLSIRRGTDRLLAFALWLVLLIGCTATARLAFLTGDTGRATLFIHLTGFVFLGLLGLALARITVQVTNLVLDPTELTSPFRPHPGRSNLAPGLVLAAIAGQVVGLSPGVAGYLILAAGAAFMDRVAEAFIGRETFRAEIMMLAGSAVLAGAGLMMTGAALLGAPWSEVAGLHLTFMGGLGLGVYTVFCIAGLLHTNRPLGLPRLVRFGVACLVLSAVLRIAPDFGIFIPGPLHVLASLGWALGFLIWLWAFWPYLSTTEQLGIAQSDANITSSAH